MNPIIYNAVKNVTDKLDDFELAVLNNVVQQDMSPIGRVFDYSKVKNLFTEENGTKAYGEVKDALGLIVCERLGE